MTKIGVSVREAGWLLSLSESQVRRLVGANRISYAVEPTRLSAHAVSACFPNDHLRPTREAALKAILERRIHVPAPVSRYAKPAPITDLPHLIRQANLIEQSVR